MILELCGGEASPVVADGAVPNWQRQYRFDPSRVETLIGLDIPEDRQRKILTDLGFTLDGTEVTPPAWRPDVLGDADIIEEIARVESLTGLKSVPLPVPAGIGRPIITPMQKREASLRRLIASQGLHETVSYSFVDEKSARAFGGGTDAVRVANPISAEMSHMRPSPYPSLLAAARAISPAAILILAFSRSGRAFRAANPRTIFALPPVF